MMPDFSTQEAKEQERKEKIDLFDCHNLLC
jgi:hypothetical protein